MPIEKVRIKNFRSLKDVEVDAKALTVFIGCNDEGKSNFLRALDLFFNCDRSGGYALDWERDFCAMAATPKNKAPQIEIRVTFRLPQSFKLDDQMEWTRVWRRTGLFRDEVRRASREPIPRRSKVDAFLRSIRYDYVPAIKGPEYFERLLGNVHDMLEATVKEDIRGAASNFTTEIRKHTQGILKALEAQIGLKSDIELPSDLKRLFTDLEFRSDAGSHRVSLSQRGDGIKVRHIPVILRWLADQANHLSAPGRPRTVTVWGYEEPENNLEIRRGFELAEFFVETSNSIQTFLTTHSPIYYSVFSSAPDTANVRIVEVRLDQNEGTSCTARSPQEPSDIDALNSSIGFLDLLEPHVRAWKEKLTHLETRLAEGLDVTQPTLFVEGPSDRTIIEAALKRLFPSSAIKVLCASQNGGGHAWVKDSLIVWQHSRGACRAVGLFDGDDGAKDSINEFSELVERRVKAPRALKHRIKPDGPALELAKMKMPPPVSIDELCPREAWEEARARGWLIERPALTATYRFSETQVSFTDWITSKIPDETLRLIATQKVAPNHKAAFSKFVANKLKDANCTFDFAPLNRLLEELLKKLAVQSEPS